MPRRVYTYDSGLGWSTLNLIVSLFSVVFAVGTLLTLYNILWSLRHGEPASRQLALLSGRSYPRRRTHAQSDSPPRPPVRE